MHISKTDRIINYISGHDLFTKPNIVNSLNDYDVTICDVNYVIRKLIASGTIHRPAGHSGYNDPELTYTKIKSVLCVNVVKPVTHIDIAYHRFCF